MSPSPNEAAGRVRVLIVDDSALMRKLLADILRTAPGIEVVGSARDGNEAVAQAGRLRPDVITLDVEMPGRTGLEVLPDLLAAHDAAVIMVSTHTKHGADVTLAALERGAIDFMPKPERHQFAQLREATDLLVGKVLAAAQARPRRRRAEGASTPSRPSSSADPGGEVRVELPQALARCMVIGISLGGPQTIGAALPLVNPPILPILVVQHMPATFTGVFAERLNRSCSVPVKEAEEGDRVIAGRILIAPGGKHMAVTGAPASARVTLSDTEPVSGHKPSIDVLFTSAARIFQAGTVGLIMTGMGRDGVEGCRAILAAGGLTLGQDEATSAVYGMNKVAFQESALTAQFALSQFPALIRRFSPEK